MPLLTATPPLKLVEPVNVSDPGPVLNKASCPCAAVLENARVGIGIDGIHRERGNARDSAIRSR